MTTRFLACGFFSVFASCALSASAPAVDAASAPRGLAVEFRENPCGLDVPAPRLAWKMGQGLRPDAKNVSQVAYRVLAATSRAKLDADEGDLWDSGRVAGDANGNVVYGGKPLASSQRVFWKVKTWCNYGKESAWSAPAEWTTGVMAPGDWKAKWIGPAACTRPDEDFGAAQWITAPADAKGVVTLETTFRFDGANEDAYVEMVHAGVSQHEIDVNGKPFNRWTGHVHDWRFLRFRDMTKWLVKGDNKVVVRVFADKPRRASDPIDPIRRHAPADVRAFLAKIVLPGGKTLVTGKAGWTSPNGAVSELGGVRAPAWGKEMVLRTENASPAFAKSFVVKKPVASAVLHVTGVGFYEASLNGSKIGAKVLDPSPTLFDRRVLYSTYRLDDALKPGANELKILVGHGWYDMRSIETWNFDTAPWRDFPRCIAQLEIAYSDGTKETVATDRTWRQVESPVGYDDVFEGEVVGTRDPRGVDLAKAVVPAEEVPAPCKRLEAEKQPGAQVMRTFPAKKVRALGGGAYVVDFGENLSGWARITLRGQKKGDRVTVRYDERVTPDLAPALPSCQDGLSDFDLCHDIDPMQEHERRLVDAYFSCSGSHRVCAPDAAFQTDRFICSGASEEKYEPRFTYCGFRYLCLKGLRRAPEPKDLVACVVHTAFPTIGSFACSDETFNTLVKMGEKAYRSNFADGVPTDCPHREKNGWTGDASIASEFAQYLFENTAGYEKWLRDVCDTQLDDGNVCCIVPTSGWGYHWGNGPGWDSALPMIAWNLWTYRGDRRILDEIYPHLVKYLDYTATRADADGCVAHGLGDWVSVNGKHRPDTAYTVSCYYYQAQRVAAEIARLRGDAAAAAKYDAGAAKTRAGVNKKWYKGGGVYDNGFQTAQGMAIAFGLADAQERAAVAARLVKSVEETGCHVDVGLYGTKHVFRALSRVGRTDLAFKMLVNPTAPSPADWIRKGGTTLWEDWCTGLSRNHVMFGDFVGWAYQYLAGIAPAEKAGSTSAVTLAAKPGFAEIVLAPQPIADLSWARARVDGPNGAIVSSWKREGGKVSYEFTVPPNTKATIRLPGEPDRTVGSGVHAFTSEGPDGKSASGAVEIVDCPKCKYYARFSDDGKSATVNRARFADLKGEAREAAVAAAVKRAEKTLAATAVADDAVRPLMGWSSWNCFATDINEEKIVAQARAMATNGLKAAGFRYVNVDDGFFGGRDAAGRLRIVPERFPEGLKGTADGIHAQGLKAGIYSDAGDNTCASGGANKLDKGGVGGGLWGHDADDCNLFFNVLGFDFIKVDSCGLCHLKLDPKTRYTEIANAIRATGRTDVRLNVCRWAYPGTWVSDVAGSWRVTGDIRASWKSIRQIVLMGLPLSAYASRGHYNDLDMLELGHAKNWTATFDGDGGLTPVEETAHFGLWCIMSSPLVLGCDLRTMPRAALDLVTNPYLVGMNANGLGLQAYPVSHADEVVTLVKDADERNGLTRYVAVANLGDEPANAELALGDVDLAGRAWVVDLVEKAEIGSFEKTMKIPLKAHEAKFYRVAAERRVQRRVYRADCAWMRQYHKLDWEGDAPLYRQMLPGAGEDWDMIVAAEGLGRRPDNDLLWRDVRVEEAGDYDFVFTVLAADPRSFSVNVDGKDVATLAVPARRWTQEVSCKVKLSAGDHEIRIFNATASAPAIVQLEIKRAP